MLDPTERRAALELHVARMLGPLYTPLPAMPDPTPEQRTALEKAARAMDAALSAFWPEGPVAADHRNYLGDLGAAWRDLRAALAATGREADLIAAAQVRRAGDG